MAPHQRSFTNPAPKTESAREARKSFFCDLCQKGYSRQNEFSAHESSYDHQHKKRLKDLKAMSKTMDPAATTKARKAEQKEAGLIKIALGASVATTAGAGAAGSGAVGGAKVEGRSGGFKKTGFKSAFGGAEKEEVEAKAVVEEESGAGVLKKIGVVENELEESEAEDEGYERYDPRRPTGCGPDCRAKAMT